MHTHVLGIMNSSRIHTITRHRKALPWMWLFACMACFAPRTLNAQLTLLNGLQGTAIPEDSLLLLIPLGCDTGSQNGNVWELGRIFINRTYVSRWAIYNGSADTIVFDRAYWSDPNCVPSRPEGEFAPGEFAGFSVSHLAVKYPGAFQKGPSLTYHHKGGRCAGEDCSRSFYVFCKGMRIAAPPAPDFMTKPELPASTGQGP